MERESLLCILVLFVSVFASVPGDCPACGQYMALRSSVLALDHTVHFDANISLSPDEQDVDQKMSALRATETQLLWSEGIFPGKVNFRDIKPLIESSSLFQLIRTMPKGGILHIHTFGLLEFLVYNASYRPDCYQNIGESSSQFPHKSYLYAANGTAPPNVNGTVWKLVNDLRTESGNVTAFDLDMIKKLSFVSPKNKTENKMWKGFDSDLTEIGSLYIYEPVRKTFFFNALQYAAQDQIQHIEIRGIGGMYGTGFYVYNESQSLGLQLQWLAEFNQQYDTNITMRWIAVDARNQPEDSIYAAMVETVQLQQDPQVGKYLVGFDLVDEEDAGNPLLYYLSDFFQIQNYTQSNGYQALRYFFHAGETEWNSELTAMNIVDAILLNTSRIGHALALRDFPSLMREIQAREPQVGIELCPISNQMLEYFDDIRSHPGVVYATQGLPITVSPDDPLIFGNDGLSYDFYAVYLSWGLSLSGLKQLAINSLQYSELSATEKILAIGEFQTRWNSWINGVIQV